MRLILIIFFIFLLSCSKNTFDTKDNKIDINKNLSFDEFKELIKKKGLEKDYPDINQ